LVLIGFASAGQKPTQTNQNPLGKNPYGQKPV